MSIVSTSDYLVQRAATAGLVSGVCFRPTFHLADTSHCLDCRLAQVTTVEIKRSNGMGLLLYDFRPNIQNYGIRFRGIFSDLVGYI